MDNWPSKLSTPIRIRGSDSKLDNETNRDAPISIDNKDEVLSIDTDGNEILSIEISGSSSHPISTTTTEKSKSRVFLWKNEYSQLFKWLKYDALKGTAQYSYSSCKMYGILF